MHGATMKTLFIFSCESETYMEASRSLQKSRYCSDKIIIKLTN